MAQSVRVEGLTETLSALRRIDRQLPGELRRVGRSAAAEVVVPEAKRRAPVGTPPKDKHPGLLQSTVRAGIGRRGAVVRAGGRRAPYGPKVHWRGWPSTGVPARPFVLDAAKATQDRVAAHYLAGVDRFFSRIGF